MLRIAARIIQIQIIRRNYRLPCSGSDLYKASPGSHIVGLSVDNNMHCDSAPKVDRQEFPLTSRGTQRIPSERTCRIPQSESPHVGPGKVSRITGNATNPSLEKTASRFPSPNSLMSSAFRLSISTSVFSPRLDVLLLSCSSPTCNAVLPPDRRICYIPRENSNTKGQIESIVVYVSCISILGTPVVAFISFPHL
jgi:hypothetical protein